MNSLIKNKKRAKSLIKKMGHKMKSFEMFAGLALGRCVDCGKMVYVAGKYRRNVYGKKISGDATKLACQFRYSLRL